MAPLYTYGILGLAFRVLLVFMSCTITGICAWIMMVLQNADRNSISLFIDAGNLENWP
jgi:hypothetical protein